MAIKAELRIVYDGDGINEKLDKDLKEVVAKHGYKIWASGYDLQNKKRDLAFDKT